MELVNLQAIRTEGVRKYSASDWRVVIVSALLFCGTLVFGAWVGAQIEGRKQAEVASLLSERDQKILAIVTKRNPQATIKDFLGFPAKLTDGAQALGLDFRYVMALIDKESEWKPTAVSPAGAIGLMQVMPETALLVVRKMGWQGYEAPSPSKASPRYNSLGSLGDPEWNLRIGMQFLKWQIDEFGLGPEHLRAYNRGGAQARANWPSDRYAEDVAFRFVALAALTTTGVAQQSALRDRATVQTAGYPAPEHRRFERFEPAATLLTRR